MQRRQWGQGRRRRREVEAYLAVVRSCGSWSCRFYAVGRRFCSFSVLFFLCSFFSPLLSPVSLFLLLFLIVVVSLLMVALVAADGGSSLRWRAVFAAVLPVCAEAQASSSSSRVLQQGEEDGERLMVALLQTAERERETEEIEVTVILFSSVFLFFCSFPSPSDQTLFLVSSVSRFLLPPMSSSSFSPASVFFLSSVLFSPPPCSLFLFQVWLSTLLSWLFEMKE